MDKFVEALSKKPFTTCIVIASIAASVVKIIDAVRKFEKAK